MYYFGTYGERDLIYKKGSSLVPVEIKSAQTYSSSFLKGLKYIKKIFPDAVDKGFLVYAGDYEQDVDIFRLINYKNLLLPE